MKKKSVKKSPIKKQPANRLLPYAKTYYIFLEDTGVFNIIDDEGSETQIIYEGNPLHILHLTENEIKWYIRYQSDLTYTFSLDFDRMQLNGEDYIVFSLDYAKRIARELTILQVEAIREGRLSGPVGMRGWK